MAREREPDQHDRLTPPDERPPTEERALVEVVRGWTGGPWLVVGLVVVRALAVIGLHPYVYVDSAEYTVVDFTGRGRRPWATSYLYWLVPGDHRWEIVGQAVVGGLCWAVLGLAVAAWFREPRVRIGVTGAVVALGLTTSITNWDTAILSESLALSLTALVVAAWLNLARRTTWVTAGLVVAATLPWLFVRQSLLPAAWLVVVVAGGVGVHQGGVVDRTHGEPPSSPGVGAGPGGTSRGWPPAWCWSPAWPRCPTAATRRWCAPTSRSSWPTGSPRTPSD